MSKTVINNRLVSTKKLQNKSFMGISPILKDYKDSLTSDKSRQSKVINYTGAPITPGITWSRHPLSTKFKVNKNVKKINCRWIFPIMWVDPYAIMHFKIIVNGKDYIKFTESGLNISHFVNFDIDIDNITSDIFDIELICRNHTINNRFAMFTIDEWSGSTSGQLVITEILE